MNWKSTEREGPKRHGLLACVLFLIAAGVVGAQQPAFRTETNLIEIDAVVTDSQGQVVRGLTKDDFIILDDGKPQPVATFSFVDIPIERSGPPPSAAFRLTGRVTRVERDVSSNERPFDGRIYILVLDDLHTTPEWTAQVRRAAQLFLQRSLADNDLMAVLYVSRGTEGSGFTDNRTILQSAIARFTGLRPSVPVVQTPPGQRPTTGVGPTVRMEREMNASRMLKLIQKISDWANDALPNRRKALLLFSQGVEGFKAEDFEGGESSASQSEFRRLALETKVGDDVKTTIDASTRANVSIYPVDARGLDNISITNGHLFLGAMAVETGGTAVLRANDLVTGFDRIVLNASSYYALGYLTSAPSASLKAGTFHEIKVQVNRPGLQVQARRGYRTQAVEKPKQAAQPKNGASPEVTAALSSPVMSTDVKLAVFAAPFRGDGKNASVLVSAEVGNLQLFGPDAGGRLRDEVELTSVVTGLREIKSSRTDRLQVEMTAERASRTGGGARMLYRLDLPAGKYQLRVVAKDVNSGRLGSVVRDLDVPDLADTKIPLAMSGIVLTSARAADYATAGQDRVASLIGIPPAAFREFSKDEELVAFVEIYDRDVTPHDDTVTIQIVNSAGRVVLNGTQPISSAAGRNERVALTHATRFRIDNLIAGRYVLSVIAKSPSGASAAREIPFTIR